ncbi:MAG: chromosomal replication initiator protein DnaA [bacterium]
MTNQQLWQAVLGELELQISKPNFTTWFKNTFILDREADKVIVGVANGFTKIWLEKKYHDLILKALRAVSQDVIREIIYKVENKKPETTEFFMAIKKEDLKNEIPEDTAINKYGLNGKYTFENFIVGKENELAHAASLAVAAKLGQSYNPLFIYGGSGLGKTHLLQAVGHQVLKNSNNKKRVLYATCEKFTNDFIYAVRNGQANEFKNIYRLVDLLMVDDIQFLAGKESTQEEFFHTFNTLHQNNKQIIICSDRPPKAISIENRLLSRFEWGMIADVGAPALETRIAILENNCKKKSYFLEREIINYIATNIQNNIRELEGALNRIIAYHQLNNSAPTLDGVKKLLMSITTTPRQSSITNRQLLNIVANFFDVSIDGLTGQSRKKELVGPRQILMYLMREEIKSSYPSIGHELGGRDHTTAIHAYLKISEEIKNNEKTRKDIELIRQRIHQ